MKYLAAMAVSGLVVMLAGCGGGSQPGSGSAPSSATAEALGGSSPVLISQTAAATSYSRQLWVDPSKSAASDTNDGSQSLPLRTISRAMQMLQPGYEVVIAPGTYYETITVPTLASSTLSTMIRAATPGSVIVRGSRPTGGWQPDASTGLSNVWSINWAGTQPEQIFRNVNNPWPLKQIGGTVYGGYPNVVPAELAGLGNIWPGRVAGDQTTLPLDAFTYNAAQQKLYVRLATPLVGSEALLVSTARDVFSATSVQNLTVQGIVFEHANTSATFRQGAVRLFGRANTLDNVTVRWMDSFCVQIVGNDNKLLNSTIDSCGQVGIAADGARITVQGNQVLRNNTRGFNKWWEAGGMKFIGANHMTDGLVKDNVVAFNHADGIWFDTQHIRNTIQGNTLAYNEGFGIQYEASYQATITDNLAYGNTQRGIYLIDSPDCLIQDNIVLGHPLEGIAITETSRATADPTLKPARNKVLHNTMGWNDLNRNYVDLVLAAGLQDNQSDRNAFYSSGISARMNLGFVALGNPASFGLAAWQQRSGQDANSSDSLGAMPDSLAQALAATTLFTVQDLPVALRTAGAN